MLIADLRLSVVLTFPGNLLVDGAEDALLEDGNFVHVVKVSFALAHVEFALAVLNHL